MVTGIQDRLTIRHAAFAVLRGAAIGGAVGFGLVWFLVADRRNEIKELEARIRAKCEALIAREAPLTPDRARWYSQEAGCPPDVVNAADPRMNI